MKWFPINLEYNRGIPINNHPGAFGNARKYNFHEGVDLYGTEGQFVYAANDGIVTNVGAFTGPEVGCDWWLPTDAVTIKSDMEYYVYGELKSGLSVGDTVKAGSVVGTLVPVLPPDKIRTDIPKHSNVMLHLEKYSLDFEPTFGWAAWKNREDRPTWLQDPTNDLIEILMRKFRKVELLTL